MYMYICIYFSVLHFFCDLLRSDVDVLFLRALPHLVGHWPKRTPRKQAKIVQIYYIITYETIEHFFYF